MINMGDQLTINSLEYVFESHDEDTKNWIEEYMTLICPYCHSEFDDEILYMCRTLYDADWIKYCPVCGNRLNRCATGN